MSDSVHARQEASVLVPVYRGDDGDLVLVVVRRTDIGPHGGQISFPGGMRESEDASPEETALREAHEEVGIEIEHVGVIAELPIVETISTGFRISPFLGKVDPATAWRREEREIAEILFVRLGDIIRPEARGEMEVQRTTRPGSVMRPYYRIGPYRLWGASYEILHPLIPRLLAGEWSI